MKRSLALQEMSVERVEESWYSRTKQSLLLFTAITEVAICVLDWQKCAANAKFMNTIDTGLLTVNDIFTVLSEFLLSSEDTAFQMDVLAECNNLLVIGTVSFSTYAASYNRRFQYCKMATTNDIDPKSSKLYLKLWIFRNNLHHTYDNHLRGTPCLQKIILQMYIIAYHSLNNYSDPLIFPGRVVWKAYKMYKNRIIISKNCSYKRETRITSDQR